MSVLRELKTVIKVVSIILVLTLVPVTVDTTWLMGTSAMVRETNLLDCLMLKLAQSFVSVDIDECIIDNGGCEVTCDNVIGSFVCQCPSGYELANNGISCRGRYKCLCVHKYKNHYS